MKREILIDAINLMVKDSLHTAEDILDLANKAQLETLLACFVNDSKKRMYTTEAIVAIIKRCG